MDGYNWTSISENITMTSSPANPSYPKASNISDVAAPLPLDVANTVMYSIVCVVGLVVNTVAIIVMVFYGRLNIVTNMYILNLALADEMYILGIPFLGINSVLSYWPYGDFFCKVCMTADAMSQFASTFCLTVMSIDRYLAVVHPISSFKWRTPQVAILSNATVWVFSFLIVLPVTIYSHVQDEFNTCNITWPEPHELWSIVFILYTSILGFFGPLFVICLCYLLILIKVRSASVRAGRTKRRKSERKVTRMVVVIVLVFVICWLPFFTTNIVNLIHFIPENNTTIYFFLVLLTYVNSCANPFIYGLLSDNFKQSFKEAVNSNKRKQCGAANQMRGRKSPPQ